MNSGPSEAKPWTIETGPSIGPARAKVRIVGQPTRARRSSPRIGSTPRAQTGRSVAVAQARSDPDQRPVPKKARSRPGGTIVRSAPAVQNPINR